MTTQLLAPGAGASNAIELVETGPVVVATSSDNSITNSGVLLATGDNVSGIFFSAASSNGTILNSGTVRGDTAALHFNGSGAVIGNSGEMTGTDFGVLVAPATDATVTLNNVFGGTISGDDTGIQFLTTGTTSQINNGGAVFGGDTGIFMNSTLVNSGEVGGGSFGVVCSGNRTTIDNTDFGQIQSPGTAIDVFAGVALISNNPDCLIAGTRAAIETEDGVPAGSSRISLNNVGKIVGKIDCNATDGNVNDVVVNRGAIDGDIFLGAGDDSFNGTGGTSGKVFGEAGNDTLIGGSANDTLDGGAGIDTLRGGLGKDTMFGGAEADIFDFNSIRESVKGAKRDVIQDFERGLDDIDLRTIDAKTGGGNQAFKFIGTQDFHDVKGELRFKDLGSKVIVQGDVNGDGKADFEIFANVGALSAGDFLL